MTDLQDNYSFDFAISYAGEDRLLAKRIADELQEGGAIVYLDLYFRSVLLGRSLRKEFAKTFSSSSRFFVPFISKYYVEKDFTNFEWQTAKEEETKRNAEFILPIRLDDSKLIGLHPDIRFCDLREGSIESIESVVKDLLNKLGAYERMVKTDWVATEEKVNVEWIATVGINIDEAINDWPKTPSFPGPLGGYAELCDWFEQDLRKRLDKSGLNDWDILEDARHGDTLSIRFRFHWLPKERPLDFGPLDWWEVLEVVPLKEIYPEMKPE